MLGSLFKIAILMPLFNLLVLIYALLPGHDFGVSIILFTIVIRLLLWPVVKKQTHQQKAMRELQPEIKRIKKRSKGDKQKEAQLLMELYREREIHPLSSLGTLFIQLPILITLFIMLRNLLDATELEAIREQFTTNAYSFVQGLDFIKSIINDPSQFNTSFLGIMDLHKPSIVLAATSAIGQYLQARQLQPHNKDAKRLRDILSDAKEGKEVDQAEQQAAMQKSMTVFLPGLTFVFALSFPAALSLYWTTSSLVAALQQRRALDHEVEDLEKTEVVVKKSISSRSKPKTKAKKAKIVKNTKKGSKK